MTNPAHAPATAHGEDGVGRPHVICHMMAPLDGRLKVEDWAPSTGNSLATLIGEYDRVHEMIGCDAWLAGRATGEEFAHGQPHPPAEHPTPARPLHVARPNADEYAVILDEGGKLHWTGGDIDGAHLVVLLGAGVPDAHLAELTTDGASYVVSEAPEVDLEKALKVLGEAFGIRTVLLEGGATTNGAFLAAGLVDEVSLVLFPAIGGRTGSASIFENGEEGLADHLRLDLLSCGTGLKGSVHLRYEVSRAAS